MASRAAVHHPTQPAVANAASREVAGSTSGQHDPLDVHPAVMRAIIIRKVGSIRLQRVTTIVAGPLALRVRRTRAARERELGRWITSFPMMAAKLAGGFALPAAPDTLLLAIRAALGEGGFSEIAAVADLPGTPRAVLATLADVWRSDLDLVALAGRSARLADLALLDQRVRKRLPAAALAPRDLRDAALARIRFAPAILGDVCLEGPPDVDPVWRPLLTALAKTVAVRWASAGAVDRSWFTGTLDVAPPAGPRLVTAYACADPRAEVVEALRWARELLARGDVRASDVAIAAATTEPYDGHFLVLARDGRLPLHFTHGVPAVDTAQGQACSALADALLRGPSQTRLRRLLAHHSPDGVPYDWAKGLRRGGALTTEPQWHAALAAARPVRRSGEAAEHSLKPLLAILFGGPAAAAEAGEAFLDRASIKVWRNALLAAPPEALEMSLGALRAPDLIEAGSCVSWGPAEHLASAPRTYVRLLGLTARWWPRPKIEDALLPQHVLPRPWPGTIGRTEHDLVLFEVIGSAATGGLALSRPRRSATGTAVAASRLWPAASEELARTRVPDHAFSEADRLLARPRDAAADPHLRQARQCWRAWHLDGLTEHDGCLPAGDAAVLLALERAQTAGSLRRLVRDPLAFVLIDALGLRQVEDERRPLTLDPRSFGELLHEVLRLAVDALRPGPAPVCGVVDATRRAVDRAADAVFRAWPLERAVPPDAPWRQTVDQAADLALTALSMVGNVDGARTWTEVSFGAAGPESLADGPWKLSDPVLLGGLPVGGRIDRLDLSADGREADVTDYKTGQSTGEDGGVELAGGRELQRVVYAAAVRAGVQGVAVVRSRLLHLGDEPGVQELSGARLDDCLQALSEGIETAARRLREGVAPPGPDAKDRRSRTRLALPAELDAYLDRKREALVAAYAPLLPLWERP